MDKPQSTSSIKALYIEDNQGQAYLLKRALEHEGIAIDWAPDYETGIRMAHSCRYDIYVVDYAIGERNGIDFIIEACQWEAAPPALILTASGNEEVAVQALKSGAADYVIKDMEGFYLSLMPTEIRQVIAKRQTELDKKKAEGELKTANAFRIAILESIESGIMVFNNEGNVLWINWRLRNLWQIPLSVEETGSFPSYVSHFATLLKDSKEFLSLNEKEQASKQEEVHQEIVKLKNGKILRRNSRPVYMDKGTIIGRVWDFQDITELNKAYEALELAANVYRNSVEGIMVSDAQGTILSTNPAFTEITGFTYEEAVGKNPRILKSNRHDTEFYKNLWNQLKTNYVWKGEIWNRRKNGEIYPEWITISAIRNNDGDIVQFVSVFHDISDMKRNQELLEHRVHHDPLTGLPNRLLFEDRVQMTINHSHRNKLNFALFFLDLDGFKKVNDTLGHLIGDELLIEVAKRLTDSVRAEDTACRLGGDEFVLLITESKGEESLATIAKKIIARVSEPYIIKGQEANVSVSIGISVYPKDGEDHATLLKNADHAMYRTKESGKKGFNFFVPDAA